MRIFFVITIWVVVLSGCRSRVGTNSKDNSPCRYVNPFIGTGSHGHTYPGATMPFGMVKLSPDTRLDGWDGCSGYHYSDSIIYGFSHTHLSGTGVSDYGDILFMPTTGRVMLDNGRKSYSSGYCSSFRHSNEIAEPGYYSVLLDKYGVKAELTVTNRVGFHRYVFPGTGKANIIIDLQHRDPVVDAAIRRVSSSELEGYRKATNWALDKQWFFVARFSKPFNVFGLALNDSLIADSNELNGKNVKAFVQFAAGPDEPVMVKVGISAVSIENARMNLDAELPGWDFEQTREQAYMEWDKELSKILVEGGTHDQKVNFYTALYHCFVTPDLFMDVDGSFRGMDRQTHFANGFTNYTVFSLWDTYRALHPLFTIVQRGRTLDFVKTLVEKYKQNGELPMWELAANDTRCMIGYHAVSVIADAYLKGIRDFNAEEALEAMVNTANSDKRGLSYYKKLGYVPFNKSSQSVSKTLEFAYNDWCIAQMAEALGNHEVSNRFAQRAQFYKNLYDTSTHFMRGRDTERAWRTPFDPQAVNYDYTEANAFQYLYVPHDVDGLIKLSGGDDRFVAWLDSLFATNMKQELSDDSDISGMIGQYAHGNEPSHHFAYLYSYAGAPWKTQQAVRKILHELYQASPSGLCGNEDCGQMSAWYVLSAMGFYPVCPGQDLYTLGSPIFDRVTLTLENGRAFTISTSNNSGTNKYIQSARLNGEAYSKVYITNSMLMAGGELNLEMGESPNTSWGASVEDRPHSLRAENYVGIPVLKGGAHDFLNSRTIELGCETPNVKIYYTLDGREPNEFANKYAEPFNINESVELRVKAFRRDMLPGYTAIFNLHRVAANGMDRSKLLPGLSYEYFEGVYRSIWDFEKEKPVRKGIVPSFILPESNRGEWLAFRFNGYIEVPADGEYTFYMRANDGGQLCVNGRELFESDGRKVAAFEQQETIVLRKGLTPISVRFFQCSDAMILEVYWESSAFKRQPIPGKLLYHE